MSGKLDIRGYVNPEVPRTTESGQRENMTGDVYVENKSGTVIDRLIRSVRKGTVVEVMELYCLAPVIGYANKRRRILTEVSRGWKNGLLLWRRESGRKREHEKSSGRQGR